MAIALRVAAHDPLESLVHVSLKLLVVLQHLQGSLMRGHSSQVHVSTSSSGSLSALPPAHRACLFSSVLPRNFSSYASMSSLVTWCSG